MSASATCVKTKLNKNGSRERKNLITSIAMHQNITNVSASGSFSFTKCSNMQNAHFCSKYFLKSKKFLILPTHAKNKRVGKFKHCVSFYLDSFCFSAESYYKGVANVR